MKKPATRGGLIGNSNSPAEVASRRAKRRSFWQAAADALPLQVNSDAEFPEDTRLRYRFLDLRREKIHANFF